MKLNLGVNGMDGPGGSGGRGGQSAQSSAQADTPAIFARASRVMLRLFAVACLLLAFVPAVSAADRSVVVTSMTLTRGATNCVPIALMAAGDENSLSFTVCFDTNALRYVTWRRIGAVDELSATVVPNALQRTNGRVGFLIALAPEEVFPAGSNGLVEICFASLQTAPASTTVVFCDSPIERGVVDALAAPLPVDWLDGTMTIPGGCSYTLSTNAASFAAAGGNGGFDLTTDAGCTWTVTNPSSWIIMTSPTVGTNSRPMSYFVEENTGASSRTGIVTVAGQTHTVVQAGLSCSFSFSPGNRNHGYGATTGSVALTTGPGCSWATVNTNAWISVTNPTGTGTGFVFYVVEANPTINTRVGYVSIGSAAFSITQSGIPCTFDLSTENRSHGHGASTGLVTFTTLAGCPWAIIKDSSWITITSPTNGTGNGQFAYNIEANPDIASRVGTISVFGSSSTNVFTITQAGQGCTISLSPTQRSHGFGATSNNITVTAAPGCPWFASTTNDWISLPGTTNGSSSGTVAYTIVANPTFNYRTGTVAIADQLFTIVQDPLACSYTLSPVGRIHGNGANANSFQVRTAPGCAWTLFNTNSWITLTGLTNGAGSNTVTYSFTANPNGVPRVGVLTLADQALNAAAYFTITQGAATCSYTVSPTTRNHGSSAATNTFQIRVIPGCPWTITNTADWITFHSPTNGSGSNIVTYSVSENTNTFVRSEALRIADKTVTISQDGAPCSYAIAPTNRAFFGATGGTGAVEVVTTLGCDWGVTNTNSWIAFAITAGNDGAVLGFTVQSNLTFATRVGVVTIAGKNYTVTQEGQLCAFTVSPTNASHSYVTSTGAVSIVASNGCEWSAINTNDWISIISGASGTGDGQVVYSVDANTNRFARTANLLVADVLVAITQAEGPCIYRVTPVQRTHGPGAASNFVTLTTSTGCVWNVVNTNAWLNFSYLTNGVGSEIIGYTVDANPLGIERVGVVTFGWDEAVPPAVAASITITQRAAQCALDLSTTNRVHGHDAAMNSVSLSVPTGCAWAISNTNGWLHILSETNGNGDATIDYSIDENPFTVSRVGVVYFIGSTSVVTLTIRQNEAPCEYTISPTNVLHGFNAETGQVEVVTSNNCLWDVTNTNSWVTITSPTESVTGGGFVAWSVAANPSGALRSGVITIAGKRLTVRQSGVPCNYAVSPTNASNLAATGATVTVSITTTSGCPWSVSDTNDWISVNPSSGSGSGSVTLTIEENPNIVPRTGTLLIADVEVVVSQAAGTCAHTLSTVNRQHGHGSASNFVNVTTQTGCTWDVSATNDWITIASITSGATSYTSPLSGTNSGSVAYLVAANDSSQARTGFVFVGTAILTLRQSGAPCSPQISPTNRVHGFSAATNTAQITLVFDCAWAVSTSNDWITIVSDTNGAGDSTLTYRLAANTNTIGRSGAIFVAGVTSVVALTISQDPGPCLFTLSPTNVLHGSGVETGSVDVLTSANCAWGVTNTNGWIHIIAPLSGTVTGNGTVTYQVDANPSGAQRVGNVMIDGRRLTVRQSGVTCTNSISPTNALNVSGIGYTGTISIATIEGCSWNVVDTNDWISISPSSGAGDGTVTFTVEENPAIEPRIGTFTVAGNTFTVSQVGAECSYRFSPTTRSHGHGPASNTVSIITLSNCAWTVNATNDWLSILFITNGGTSYSSPLAGTNNGSLSYAIEANPSSVARTGYITIEADGIKATLPVTQAGAPCDFEISPVTRNHGNHAATNTATVTVALDCAWTLAATNDWIVFVSGTNGVATDTFTYRILANPITFSRTGVIEVVGATGVVASLTLIQDPAACQYSISPTNALHDYTFSTGAVSVTTSVNCAWAVTNTNSWITILAPASGVGNGVVAYEVAPNPAGTVRVGHFTVQGNRFTITQAGQPCGFAITPSTFVGVDAAGYTNIVSVNATSGCVWSVVDNIDWIDVTPASGAGDGTATLTVAANPAALTRTGAVLIAGQTFTVSQLGADCTYQVSPANRSHGHGAATNDFDLITLAGCQWTVSEAHDWITILSPATGTNNGTIIYTITANPSSIPRTGTVTVADQTITASATLTLVQDGAECIISISPTNRNHGYASATNTVTVTSPEACPWTVATTNEWIRLLSGTNGSGSNVVTYAVDANPVTFPRTGAVVIASQTLIIAQDAAPCQYALSAVSANHDHLAQNGTVDVLTSINCSWGVTNTNGWISIVSGGTGTGNAAVTYALETNATGIARTGLVSVAGRQFAIRQSGTPCAFTIVPTAQSFNANSHTGTVTLTSVEGCPWAVSNPNGWISVTPTSGLGNGAQQGLTYVVAANETALSRTGVVAIAGQVFTITQSGAGCAYQLSANAFTNGPGLETNTLVLTTLPGCVWTVSTTNDWIQIQSAAAATNSGNVAFIVASNLTHFARTGLVVVADQTITVYQEAAPCTYAISPLSDVHDYPGETGTVSVITIPGCDWTVEETNDWVTIIDGASGTGPGTVTYVVAGNTDSSERTAVITIAGQTYTISQHAFECLYSLSPTNAIHSYGFDVGTVELTATENCPWIAVTTNDWIVVTSATNGTGSATITYSVSGNTTTNARSGILLICGERFYISQEASPCGFSFSPPAASHSHGAVTGQVAVTTHESCDWSVIVTNSWITLLSDANAAGAATVVYALAANTTIVARTATILIGDQPYTITQSAAPCTFTLSATNASHGHTAETGAVSVTTLLGCAWTVLETNDWIIINSSLSNTNDGVVSYSLTSNGVALARTGVIVIGDVLLTVTQAGAPCGFALSPASASHGHTNSSGSFAVNTLTGCVWSAQTTNDWIQVSSSASVTNSGTVNYTVLSNPTAIARSGLILVEGQEFQVTQAGAPCGFTLSANGAAHGHTNSAGSFGVSTLTGCVWTAQTTAGWIQITSGPSVTNSGTVSYSVLSNPTAIARSGIINVQGQEFLVTQSGAPCSFTLSLSGASHGHTNSSGSFGVNTLTGCVWTAQTTNTWIQITSGSAVTNSGTVTYTLSSNPTAIARSGIINVQGQEFQVTQSGAPCSFTLTSSGASHGHTNSSGSFGVNTLVGCVWNPQTTNNWIQITSGSTVTNSGTVTYTLSSNPTAIARSGIITVQGQPYSITQSGAPCSFTLTSASASHGHTNSSGSFGVNTLIGCVWSAQTSSDWIQILSTGNITNSGTVSYSVLSNPTAIARSGIVNVGGQQFQVTQSGAPCSFSLASSSASHGHLNSSGSFGVNTLTGCVWSAQTTNDWIQITSAASVTNSGSVTYNVSSNPTAIARSGFIAVQGQQFQVTQSGAPCSFTLSASSASHGHTNSSGSFGMNTLTGCVWTAQTTNNWIQITSAATVTNSGSVTYTVSSNPTAIARSGVITVQGQQFQVTQSGAPCSFTLSASSASHGHTNSSGSFSVNTLTGCVWTAQTTNNWIQITSAATVTNSGSVTYTVSSNPTAIARSGTINVGGQQFQVTQSGAPCSYALQSNSAGHGPGRETGSVMISTLVGCSWTVQNSNSWITLLTPSGTNSGPVSYVVASNTVAIARSGNIVIQGLVFQVTQAAAACVFSLSPSSTNHTLAAQTGQVAVTAVDACSWTVVNPNTWITILSPLSNTNSGAVTYAIEENIGPARSAVITIAGAAFTVNQESGGAAVYGAPFSATRLRTNCVTFNLRAQGTEAGVGFSIAYDTNLLTFISARRGSAALENGAVLNVNSSTPGRVGFAMALPIGTFPEGSNNVIEACFRPNAGSGPTNTILRMTNSPIDMEVIDELANRVTANFSNVPVSIQPLCLYALSSNSASFSSAPGNGAVTMMVDVGCSWNVVNTNAWITITPGFSGNGTGQVSFAVAPNPIPVARSGVITIGGLPFTVNQAGIVCVYTVAPTSTNHTYLASTGSVSVTTSNVCSWNVINTNAWITTSSLTVTGNAAVVYTLASNPTAMARSGFLTIAGQPYSITQAGAPCNYTLIPPSQIHTYNRETGNVAVSAVPGCVWTNLNTNTWITIVNGSGNGAGTFTYVVSVNTRTNARSGFIQIADKIYSVTQNGAPCQYDLVSYGQSHGYGSENGTIQLVTGNACLWTAISSNSWITLAATNGSGAGSINYSVASNPSSIARTGTVWIAGLTFTVTQAGVPCIYVVAPSERMHPPTLSTGHVISVATFADCPWPISNTNAWITITAIDAQQSTMNPPAGVGSGTITYSVAANPTSNPRSGYMTVAGERILLSQPGANCDLTVSPPSVVHSSMVTTGQVAVSVISGCSWPIVNTNLWISILSINSEQSTLNPPSGVGTGTVRYAVFSNSTAIARTGILNIGGVNFSITQQGAPCSYTLSPSNRTHSSTGTVATVDMRTLVGCSWTVQNSNNWLSFSPTNGSGDTTISYTVGTNMTAFARTGIVVIADQVLTITQSGAPCNYSVTPTSRSHTHGAATGDITVNTIIGCNWAVGYTNEWIRILTDDVGTGPGLVTYALDPNPTSLSRTGYVFVSGQTFTVIQSGAPCAYDLMPTNVLHTAEESTNSFAINTLVGCAWTVVNTNTNWVFIVSTTNGVGPANVTYHLAPNPSPAARSSVIRVMNQNFLITQAGLICDYSVPITNRLHNAVDDVAGVISVNTSPLCEWTIYNTNEWVLIKPSADATNRIGSDTVRYNVTANLDPAIRRGVVTVAGVPYFITQLGTPCNYSLSPTNAERGSGLSTGLVNIATAPACPWTVINTNSWIELTATNGVGNFSLGYRLLPNPTADDRVGVFYVEGQAFTIRQLGGGCTFSIAPASTNHTYNAATGQVRVATFSGCVWNVSKTNTWITILSGLSGMGSNTVTYSVSSNSAGMPRSGTITIADQVFQITQGAAPCSFSLSHSNRLHSGAAESFTLTVTATAGCVWGVTNTNSWVTISTGLRGTNTGPVSYSVDANPTAVGRTGHVQIAGHVFTVAQLGATCGYTLNPSNRVHTFAGGTSTIAVATLPGCNWIVGNTNSWIQILAGSGVGTGTVTYVVLSNTTATARTGNLLIGGQRFGVTQQPVPFACSADKVVECGTFWLFDAPQSSGLCPGSPSIVVLNTVTNLSAFCGGFIATRTWEASDSCSNRVTCSQTVTVRDTSPPLLTCPTNKTAECGTAWTFDSPTATDACAGASITVRILSTTTNFTCGNSYIATRTWEASDPCTNRITCSQVVSVRDTTPPVVNCPPPRNVEFGATWTFDSPTGVDACDGIAAIVRVLTTVTNTTGFCGPAFSVTRTWELSDICSNKVTCSQTINVRDTTPPVLTCPANKIVSCGQPWSFDTPTATDIGDGTDVEIIITGGSTNGSCPGTFTATRTWQARDRCGNVSTCSQTVMNTHATISGSVLYYSNSVTIAGLPVRCNGSTNLSMQSGSDGAYSFNLNPGGTYTIFPAQPPLPAPGSMELGHGVTTLDISHIRRHILNPANRFDTPYKLLAADVNTNGSVSTVDISMVRRFILGVSNTLPPGLWRYVPSDYSFPNPDSPWNAPGARVHSSLSTSLSGQNFYAIKMGDVNHSWTPLAPAMAMAMASEMAVFENGIIYENAEEASVTFSVSCHTNAPAEPVTLYVKVKDFHEVTSVQFSMEWDPALLQFRETSDYALNGLSSGNFGTAMVNMGKLVLSWDDPSSTAVTLPDGTAIFSVTFDVVTEMACVAPVHIVTNGSFQPEVAVNFELAAFRAQSGHVVVMSDHVQPPQLSGAGFRAGEFSLAVPTSVGRRYVLEFTDSLSDSNWQAFEAIEGDGTVKVLSDPSPNSQQRFYRIRVE